jgi:16S rRNA (cytosine1402-N4)-methyltransferase
VCKRRFVGNHDKLALKHVPIMLAEIVDFLPKNNSGKLLDVTAGGGGHFFEILSQKDGWTGQSWDQDPAAAERIAAKGRGLEKKYSFVQKSFGEGPSNSSDFYTFILADLGISSFQLDDPERGLSFHSDAPLDFRMNPQVGLDFASWLEGKSVRDLEEILVKYGEELRAKKVALHLKEIPQSSFKSAKIFAAALMDKLHLRIKKNESHPLTRVFQALRIAINDELGELDRLLKWAPRHLEAGGRLAVISFHSLEDRKVKRNFESFEKEGTFKILTPKALTPSVQEIDANPRSRSAKLRVLERV